MVDYSPTHLDLSHSKGSLCLHGITWLCVIVLAASPYFKLIVCIAGGRGACSVGCHQHAKEEAIIHVAELIQALISNVFVLSEACWNVDCELFGYCCFLEMFQFVELGYGSLYMLTQRDACGVMMTTQSMKFTNMTLCG